MAAWKWGTVTNSSFPSSPPLKPQKPLKAQHRPVLPERTEVAGKKETSGVWAAFTAGLGIHRAISHWSLMQCVRDHLPLTARVFTPGEILTYQNDLGSGRCLGH